jgi:hypothetical protein
VAAAVIALSSSIALAQKTAPGDRVYVLHSQAQGTCPALDWHIVATPGGVLSGMLAWPDRKMVARVSGSIVPHVKAERSGRALGSDPQIQEFRMTASEIGHHGRIANTTGIIQPTGVWLQPLRGQAWFARASRCRCLSLLRLLGKCR